MSNNFCPHLTFRLSFRYDRQNSLSIGDCVEQNAIHSSAGQEDECSSPRPPPSVSTGGKEGGGDGICENGLVVKDVDKNEDSNLPMLIDDVQPSLCDMCESSPPSPAQWRCLDHRCGLVLCGTQASNHSQYHFDVSKQGM